MFTLQGLTSSTTALSSALIGMVGVFSTHTE